MCHHLLCYQNEFERLKTDFDIQKFLRKQSSGDEKEGQKSCEENVRIQFKKVLNKNLTS